LRLAPSSHPRRQLPCEIRLAAQKANKPVQNHRMVISDNDSDWLVAREHVFSGSHDRTLPVRCLRTSQLERIFDGFSIGAVHFPRRVHSKALFGAGTQGPQEPDNLQGTSKASGTCSMARRGGNFTEIKSVTALLFVHAQRPPITAPEMRV
jgi:hypothetical protein